MGGKGEREAGGGKVGKQNGIHNNYRIPFSPA